MTSSHDKVLPIPPMCLKDVVLKSVRKDNSNDMYFFLSSLCGSPAMKRSGMLLCRDNVNLGLPLPYLPLNFSSSPVEPHKMHYLFS